MHLYLLPFLCIACCFRDGDGGAKLVDLYLILSIANVHILKFVVYHINMNTSPLSPLLCMRYYAIISLCEVVELFY